MSGTPGCEVRVTSCEQKKGDFATSITYSRHLALPDKFELENVQRAQRDCEILGRILHSHPEDMSQLLELILKNDVAEAKQVASKLGLTEEDFTKQGGGFLWIVVIVVVLIATNAY